VSLDSGVVRLEHDGPIARVRLSRPEVHNAFDPQMIGAVREIFDALTTDNSCRAVVLGGEGPSFCAGADLRWMRDSLEYTAAENLRDAQALAAMLQAVAGCPIPVVARVHGSALGGGVGLVAACDIVIAADDARFGFTEARLGLAPAVVAPYVVARIGAGRARSLFLTADRFDTAAALRIGLVDTIVPETELDSTIERTLASILANGPNAVRACKALLARVGGSSDDHEAYVTSMIAALRISAEGQEGVRAFLEKRVPSWRRLP
jgi:methylglutaconyl-CoA hydratase